MARLLSVMSDLFDKLDDLDDGELNSLAWSDPPVGIAQKDCKPHTWDYPTRQGLRCIACGKRLPLKWIKDNQYVINSIVKSTRNLQGVEWTKKFERALRRAVSDLAA